jgi:DNA-directed RNA polymerase specialized sigma24 family protein
MDDTLAPIAFAPRARRAAVARRAGEAARWTALTAHARSAAAAVLRLPLRHADVEDVAQDALVLLLSSGLPRFDASRGTPEALVRVIARNRAFSLLRRRALGARAGEELGASGRERAGEAEHRRVEAAADLEKVLRLLRPDHAQALVSIDLVGERIGDSARRQGRSYAAVNAEVGHARSSARRVARELVAA